MAFIPKRITLTVTQGFDQETSRRLHLLATRAGVDPRALAARLLAEAVAVAFAATEEGRREERDVDTQTGDSSVGG